LIVELRQAKADLRAREPIFHRTELGTTRADFDRATAPDFWEVGASGRVYQREYVWSVLEARYASGDDDPWSVSGFRVRALGGDTFLATYDLAQGDRLTRRATVWTHTPEGWVAQYHQGTVISPEALE
jgi:hypothetical protein